MLKNRLKTALILLERHQGIKTWSGPVPALDVLVLTLLSQNTNDKLRDKAYDNLRRHFPIWDDVLKATVEQVESAIKIAGLSKQKAERMQALLRWVREKFDGFDLAALDQFTDHNALELLQERKGIGIKTAAVTMMIAFGRDLCPVDTHVHRIAGRLGWIPSTYSAEKTFEALHSHIPDGKGYSLHMNLLQFGRTICQARKPKCGICFLWDECRWTGKGGKGDVLGEK